MPDEQLFFSLHHYTLDSSDNPLIFINLSPTILPSATYSLLIQSDSHKGQVCVCVSSSVPKSDSQNGFAAIQHSRGHAAITQTHANEAMCDGGSQDWSSWCTCYKVEPYLLTTQLFQAVSGRVRLVMAVEKITCCRPCIFAFITHDWFSRSPSYRSKLLSYKCVSNSVLKRHTDFHHRQQGARNPWLSVLANEDQTAWGWNVPAYNQ